MKNETRIWNADLYLRLSKDDCDKTESNSIKNQWDMLLDFVSRNPVIRVAHILADDGFTGANFDRDAFKAMIRHIESGEVDCVIVKVTYVMHGSKRPSVDLTPNLLTPLRVDTKYMTPILSPLRI